MNLLRGTVSRHRRWHVSPRRSLPPGLGKLYRRTGQREQAREHVTTATTMYREMDIRFYLEQAEAAMRELA